MAENKRFFPIALAPHIHRADSVAKRYWGQVVALMPVVFAACFFGKAEFLHVLLLSFISAIAFEFLGAKLFGKKDKLYHGEAILIAVLTATLMPSGCPSEAIIFANFLAVFVAKEVFGGMGEYLFHPVLFALVFLQESFPGMLAEPRVFQGGLWILAAIGVGGLILLKQEHGYWETPFLYVTLHAFCSFVLGRWAPDPRNFFCGVLFTAFFLLADPVVMPLTRRGTRLFVSGAALLSALLSPQGFSIAAAGFSILLMNLLTPWLDIWLRPRPFVGHKPLKAGILP